MGANQEIMAVVAFQIFPKKIQNLWNVLDLRVAVLISLSFQIILIFFASSRRRSGSLVTLTVIWSCYLLADWIAAFAVGIISSSQGEKCEKSNVNDELAAFWAPFLLLHLGGPDTITAFSLEDNALWIRHMLNVIVQVIAVGYVFMQSLPNKFWIPSALMFLAGTIKYAERTRALYLACLGNLKDSLKPKPDPGPNYAQLMEEYSSNREAEVPEEIYIVPELQKATAASTVREKKHLGEEEMIQHAYSFYNVFRGLIVDHMFSFHERNESRKKFFSLSAKDAFKIMEIELNFLYDALFTKMEAVHHGFFGYFWRFLCSALLVAAFVLFASHHKPGIYQMPLDRAVTYALLGGAVILDFVALVKLIFSDWTVALAKHSRVLSILAIQPLLRKLKVISGTLAIHKFISSRSRWSNYMYQFNLISYCLRKRHLSLEKAAAFLGLEELLDTLMHRRVSRVHYLDKDDGLKEFIFNELEAKALKAEDTKLAKDIYAAKGEWSLLEYDCPNLVEQSVSEDVEYDESVLLWHIATEICFQDQISSTDENRNLCKHLSDYMLYLFIMQPKLMLSVSGIAHIRFQDTCEEARKFFDRSRRKLAEKDACEKLIGVDTAVKPVEVKGDRSKSLLFDAVMLARDLREMMKENPQKTWEMMSKVWLELLCYGASHCRGDAHAQQLWQGGELITFVWLLMAHFGLGEQFRIQAGHARAKLIVDK